MKKNRQQRTCLFRAVYLEPACLGAGEEDTSRLLMPSGDSGVGQVPSNGLRCEDGGWMLSLGGAASVTCSATGPASPRSRPASVLAGDDGAVALEAGPEAFDKASKPGSGETNRSHID